jgi:hypothetical protein
VQKAEVKVELDLNLNLNLGLLSGEASTTMDGKEAHEPFSVAC